MSEKIANIKDELAFKRKNVYHSLTDDQKREMTIFSEKYKSFLDKSKTERESVKNAVNLAEENGFKKYNFGDELVAGGKYYYNNRGKSIFLFVIGFKNLEEGINISIAHIDSPKLDLKQHPLYDAGNMAFFKTHYYGGIKKYQWTAIPLAIHGKIVKSDLSEVEICIGEDESDPVFYINDLLPHLAKDLHSQSLGEGISGERLNVLIGSEPFSPEGEIKLNVLKILNEKYGIKEFDFVSSELSAVPAFKSRDIGFDRSLIGGYGHDDRVCAFPALMSIIEAESPENTLMVVLADKEETGSGGSTGMQSNVFSDLIYEISDAFKSNPRKVIANSKCLSADVNACFDPNFSEVYEGLNSCYLNEGVVMTKYTGSRGKSGTSDASAEFVGYVRKLFDDNGVVWQTGELGKVDQGGGGTVAIFVANKNIDVVDLGVPVISMHSPYEIISKADLYMTYKAFKAFNK